MTTTPNSLPELPQAAMHEQREFASSEYVDYYTAAQMLAFREEGIRAAIGAGRGENESVLLRYGRHDADCATCHDSMYQPRPSCTCGFEAALKQENAK